MRQSQLAAYTGLALSTVNAWLRRGSVPKPEQCAAIARVLHVPLAEVLEAAGYPVPDVNAEPAARVPDHLLPVMPLLLELRPEEIPALALLVRGLLEARAAREGHEPQQPAPTPRARGRGRRGRDGER